MNDEQASGNDAHDSYRTIPVWLHAAAMLLGFSLVTVAVVIPLLAWILDRSGRVVSRSQGTLDLLQYIPVVDANDAWQVELFRSHAALLLVWMLLLPVAILFRRRVPLQQFANRCRSFLARPGVCFCLCALAGMSLAAWFGWPIRHLAPRYDDEYSYLLQAQTFLEGRLVNPPSPLGTAVDQTHVLTDGRYLSRYFPGTGLWMAPFLAASLPIAGWWILAGLTAAFTSMIAWRFSPLAGYLAGLGIAAAPGTIVLSNVLLSPAPTTCAVSTFVWAFFATFERRRLCWPILAGLTIGFAFLTRPLTAFGLGFPFAIYMLVRYIRQPGEWTRRRLVAMLVGFLPAPILLAAYNDATIGAWWQTPYGRYIADYTPSHVYGFYNVQRGAKARGPRTRIAYDQWVEDLGVRSAVAVTHARWTKMFAWTLSPVPISMLLLVALLRLPVADDRVLLLWLSMAGLATVYFPYWFTGLLGFSYIAEAIPMLAGVLATALASLVHDCLRRGWPLLGLWWLGSGFIGAVLNVVWVVPVFYDPGSEHVSTRLLVEQRRRIERQAAQTEPILVLVRCAENDIGHPWLVHNGPSFNERILRAWYFDETNAKTMLRPDFRAVMAHVPDRAVYVLDYDDLAHYRYRKLREPIRRR